MIARFAVNCILYLICALLPILLSAKTVMPGRTYSTQDALSIYHELGLRKKLDFQAFYAALKYLDRFNFEDRDLVCIADFTKSSSAKRLWIIDLSEPSILFNTWVAHGKKSGEEFATTFSNLEDSNQSSLGVYKTAETYYGIHGYSMRLDGLQPGLNDNARKRYITFHSADYVSQDTLEENGFMGNSEGCLAVDIDISRKIINRIKDGTMILVYAEPLKEYLPVPKLDITIKELEPITVDDLLKDVEPGPEATLILHRDVEEINFVPER